MSVADLPRHAGPVHTAFGVAPACPALLAVFQGSAAPTRQQARLSSRATELLHCSDACARSADSALHRALQGLLTAVPLEEAVQALRQKWNSFFAADGAAKTARNPRLARITQRRSSLGPIPEAEVNNFCKL